MPGVLAVFTGEDLKGRSSGQPRLVDIAASEMGVDKADIRRRNMIPNPSPVAQLSNWFGASLKPLACSSSTAANQDAWVLASYP